MDGFDDSVKMPEFNILDETERGVILDKGMKQVLALLAAYFGEKRVMLRASPSGVLSVASAEVKDIIHVTDSNPNYNYNGNDIQCTEALVLAHPENVGRIWARPYKEATVNNAWPLDACCYFGFTIHNLNELHILIETADDVAIICYTK